MDHVINSLRQWLEVYRDEPLEEQDRRAIMCIENAIKELNKYYKRDRQTLDEVIKEIRGE